MHGVMLASDAMQVCLVQRNVYYHYIFSVTWLANVISLIAHMIINEVKWMNLNIGSALLSLFQTYFKNMNCRDNFLFWYCR